MKILKLTDKYGEVFDYEDFSDEKGYFYEITFLMDSIPDRSHSIIVMPHGVNVEWHLQSEFKITYTNIVPSSLFPGKEKLDDEDLLEVMDTLRKIKFEGQSNVFSREDIKELYEDWKSLGEKNDNN
jgi:hypothetical protein